MLAVWDQIGHVTRPYVRDQRLQVVRLKLDDGRKIIGTSVIQCSSVLFAGTVVQKRFCIAFALFVEVHRIALFLHRIRILHLHHTFRIFFIHIFALFPTFWSIFHS